MVELAEKKYGHAAKHVRNPVEVDRSTIAVRFSGEAQQRLNEVCAALRDSKALGRFEEEAMERILEGKPVGVSRVMGDLMLVTDAAIRTKRATGALGDFLALLERDEALMLVKVIPERSRT